MSKDSTPQRVQLSAIKSQLLKQRLRGKPTKSSTPQTIAKRTRSEFIPLSFAQQRLWFIEQYEENNCAYNIPFAFRLKGRLHIVTLERSLNEIVRRHEALRTLFITNDGKPEAVILPALSVSLPLNDFRTLPQEQREIEIHALIDKNVKESFKLDKAPLFRFLLMQVDEQEYILLMTIHHIIFDGWSIGVFMRELSQLYEEFSCGKSASLAELPIQYGDFAQWQREWLKGETLKHQLSYWKKQLLHSPPVLDLLTDRSRPLRQTFCGAIHSFVIPNSIFYSLKALSAQQKSTLFMCLLTAFKVLLYRYTGQDDVLVGTPIANRHRSELEDLIGFFVNTLVLRTNLSGESSFYELLKQVRKTTLEAQSHQDIPFDLLVEELHPERNLSHQPLFQVVFSLREASEERLKFSGITVEPMTLHNGAAKFDLFLEVIETDRELTGTFEYNTDLFDKSTIRRMAEHFQVLLRNIVENPHERLTALTIMTEAEQQRILKEWNKREADYPKDSCIHELFEAQAVRKSDTIAVRVPASSSHIEQRVTYKELNRKANKLAHYLQKVGVGPEAHVGLCVERSFEMIIGILGILKAGAAYVPLDPNHPDARLHFILEDSQAFVLLTQEKLMSRFLESSTYIVCLDADWETIELEDDNAAPPLAHICQQNQAYVIYTSGSTGNPKGVLIEHKSVVAFLYAFEQIAPSPEASFVGVSVCSYGFDVSVWEFFSTLCFGGTLHVLPTEILASPENFVNYLTEHHITSTYIPPSLLPYVIRDLERLKSPIELERILVGVEPIKQKLLQRLRDLSSQIRIINGYGPTEATVCATFFNFLQVKEPEKPVPIGNPINGDEVYILDPNAQPVPIGVPGEIYLGGDGLARGYLNRPELTKERFIANPFRDEPGARLYKTGDLARYLPDGNIEFLGRIDHQVKIRGFRIELGEIESVLLQYPGVHEAVVLAREAESGDKYLAAYLVIHQEHELSRDELRRFLGEHLPDYMIPAFFSFLQELPLTPNAKIDRRALPEPEMSCREIPGNLVNPRNSAEERMAEIWASLLPVKSIGVHDNFFDLGGHSLLTVQLVSEIEKLFQVKLPLWRLFESPTIAGLAKLMQEEEWKGPEKTVLESQKVDYCAETLLDETIRPKRIPPAPPLENEGVLSENSSIFLTGATGFLGAFLLHELLQQTQTDIYCLVRASDVSGAKKRITETLQNYQIWSEALRERIIPVPGDLSLPLFGLSPEEFDVLAQKLDRIYHSGAQVNLQYPYSALKGTNVQGTQEVLRLAAKGGSTPVHFVSTVGVFSSSFTDSSQERDGSEPITEACPLPPFEELTIGYAQTKWVAEKLMMIAHKRGIPVTIYRPGRISGHSQTGVWNLSDFACRTIKGCIESGIAPQRHMSSESWVPVDYVSRAILHLSLKESSAGQVFHLVNRQPLDWEWLFRRIAGMGYPMKILAYECWRREFCRHASENALSPLMPLFPESLPASALQHFAYWNTIAGLEGSAIHCPPVDDALIYTYMAYFLRCKFLYAPQLAN